MLALQQTFDFALKITEVFTHTFCKMPFLIFLIALMYPTGVTEASRGDNSWVFSKCMDKCDHMNCTKPEAFLTQQAFHLRLLGWDCTEECKYHCMWHTVEAFQKDGSPIPQFFGKWPFIRVLGVQEPASVVFSILNGLVHVIMILKLRDAVPSTTPFYTAHHVYAIVCVNAWIWSTIFHTRDFPFTEKMDYFCATSLVLSSAYILCLRALGRKPMWKPVVCAAAFLAFFFNHVYYLGFVKFDYGYNMKVNIVVGVINSLGWLAWWHHHYRDLPHSWKSGATVLSLNLLVCLELGDFPPFLWTFDAHSLWHAATVPVACLWYSFVIDDCKYLHEKVQGLQEVEEFKNAELGFTNNAQSKKDR